VALGAAVEAAGDDAVAVADADAAGAAMLLDDTLPEPLELIDE